MDRIEGYLEVGCDEQNQIVINHPDLKPDENGVGHIVFSPNQARNLARLLLKNADDAEALATKQAEEIRLTSIPPVNRSARVLTNGVPESEMPDYREIDSTGMQKSYVVLTPEERAKGFVRPVRLTYRHLKCGAVTRMAQSIAETYARDPGFYNGTYCVGCGTHLPLNEFVWDGTSETVGS